jgi:hypothetical protein
MSRIRNFVHGQHFDRRIEEERARHPDIDAALRAIKWLLERATNIRDLPVGALGASEPIYTCSTLHTPAFPRVTVSLSLDSSSHQDDTVIFHDLVVELEEAE